ncbi:MAG: lycopene cyclase domain-containing protein [Flavobacteriales bacterium]|nr:lycopene cyclase domain-containing protein [Flavobacteriales bacterium]
MERYYYLGLDLFSLAFPLLRSFDPRISFWKKWPGLFTGILVMSMLFIPWDVWFTAQGVWGFNPRYLVGIGFFGLPIEEWLFFLLIPYACLFLYEVMRYFVKRDVLGGVARPFSMGLIAVLLTVGLIHLDRLYTSVTFLLTAAFLLWHVWKRTPWLGRFYVGYAVSLIPFFLVNGILTGWLLPEPIVWYNNAENLGIRLNTVPLDDSMYLLLMLLIVTTFYERPLKRMHGDLPAAGQP